MPSYQDFTRDQVEADVEVRGLPIHVVYSPDNLRMRDIDMLTRAEREEDFGLYTKVIKRFIDEWDVTGPLVDEDTDEVLVEDGEVIPFTVECLEVLDWQFVTEFISAIRKETVEGPNPTKGKARSPKPSRGSGRTRKSTKTT